MTKMEDLKKQIKELEADIEAKRAEFQKDFEKDPNRAVFDALTWKKNYGVSKIEYGQVLNDYNGKDCVIALRIVFDDDSAATLEVKEPKFEMLSWR